jgi:hypothetical protein
LLMSVSLYWGSKTAVAQNTYNQSMVFSDRIGHARNDLDR